jgi:hypothetical protein
VTRALVVVLLLAVSVPARAQDCEARLGWIDARLGRTARHARLWSWGWGIGLGVSTVGSLVAAPFVAEEERPDWYVNAFTSAVGMLPLIIAPLPVMHDADEVHGLTGDACARLAQAELLLARDAQGERAGRAWWNHALNVVLNGGAGLFLGLVYDRWQSGILTAVVGTAVGEVMIFTQPTGSLDAEAAYRRGELSLTVKPLTHRGDFGVFFAGSF